MHRPIAKPLIILSVTALLVGFLLTIAFRSLAPYNDIKIVNNEYQQLLNFIDELEASNASLEDQIRETREQIADIQSQQTADEGTLLSLQKKLSVVSLAAGYVEARGEGIIVTLDDNAEAAALAQKNSPDTYKAENFIIHDYDLLYIIKDLAKYTEGVAINNQRIVSSSHIRCVGTVIMVNSVRLAPPYEIRLIGNPDLLQAALTASGTFTYLDTVKDMPVTVARSDKITLPAYTGSFSMNYATPYIEETN